MNLKDLLLSGLNITEDDYDYKGLFILSGNDISVTVDIAELQNDTKINELKKNFGLEEPCEEVRKFLMSIIIEMAAISSQITEGENYEENSRRKRIEKAANSLDMA